MVISHFLSDNNQKFKVKKKKKEKIKSDEINGGG